MAQLENWHKNVRKLYLNESVICSRLETYGLEAGQYMDYRKRKEERI